MKENELICMRNDELYTAYRNAWRDSEVRSHEDAIRRAIATPSSRYWMSTLQACRSIIRLKKGLPLKGVNDFKLQMIKSIYERYKELAQKKEFQGCSTFFITSFAVQKEAPQFYLSYHRALAVISKMNRKRKGVHER